MSLSVPSLVILSYLILSRDQPGTRSRSLIGSSRVNRAVEAARRVQGGLIARSQRSINVGGGLRTEAGAPTDAGSERPAGREGDRRAEQGGTSLRGPARLVKQPVRHSARDPSRVQRALSDERLRLGAQGAAHADGKGQEPQARRTRLVGWDGILAGRQGPLEVAVRRTSRGVRVLLRDPENMVGGVVARLQRAQPP